MDKNTFGLPERIRQLREQKGMTQSELARLMHLSRASVSSWEMGLSLPSLQSIAELSRLFDVSADFLLGVDSGATVCVDGLSDREVKAVMEMIYCFRENKNA